MLDESAGELMRQIIILMYMRTASWSHTSNPIPYAEIKSQIKTRDIPGLTQYLDQYLRLIGNVLTYLFKFFFVFLIKFIIYGAITEEDSRQFLKRVGDSGGGQFSVDVKEAFAHLAWATIENIVMERFGSKGARIFR